MPTNNMEKENNISEMKSEIHPCDGITGGYRRLVWPIPSCVSGKWYLRQWHWWGSFFKSVKCLWLGCEVKWRDYEYSERELEMRNIEDRSFYALECTRKGGCGGRFVIFHKIKGLK